MPRICTWICAALFLPKQLFAESAGNQNFTPPSPVITAGNMLQLSAGLLMVLVLIILITWLFRKIGIHPGNKSGLLKVIASVSVGQKERIILTEIDDTWLILGVSPGHVSLLHRMHRKITPAGDTAHTVSTESFPEKLQANLKQDHEH